jgi:Tol biopolymer transport system component
MKPQTGDRAILTHNTANGYIAALSWTPDGSRIFYDRFATGAPGGVFSVSVLGGEERRVLEDGRFPRLCPTAVSWSPG